MKIKKRAPIHTRGLHYDANLFNLLKYEMQ